MVIFHCYVSSPEGTENCHYLPGSSGWKPRFLDQGLLAPWTTCIESCLCGLTLLCAGLGGRWPRAVSLWTYYFEESASSTTSSWSLQKSLPQCFYRSILEAVEFEWLGGWVWTGATVNSSKSTQVFRFKNAAPQPNGDRFNAIPQFRWQWSRHLRRHLRFGSGQRNGSLTTNIGR